MPLKKLKLQWKIIQLIIEVFNVRQNQIDFFMNMNKPYIIGSDAYDLINELKKPDEVDKEPEYVPKPKAVPKPKPVSEALKDTEDNSKPITETIEEKLISKPINDLSPVEPDNKSESLSTETINKPVSDEIEIGTVPEIEENEIIKKP